MHVPWNTASGQKTSARVLSCAGALRLNCLSFIRQAWTGQARLHATYSRPASLHNLYIKSSTAALAKSVASTAMVIITAAHLRYHKSMGPAYISFMSIAVSNINSL